MKVNLNDNRYIEILVDEQQNIVIFPISKSEVTEKNSDGTVGEYEYHCAYFPIELKWQYTKEQLAEKIEFGLGEWNKHKCYERFDGKNTLEEKYFGIKGFQNAVRGKKQLYLGWNNIEGKFVSLSLPVKRGYAYYGIKNILLNEKADWIDYAETVLKLLDLDLSKECAFRSFKKQLNI